MSKIFKNNDMTLLEFFFIVSAVTIFITALDMINKRKFSVTHFFIFLFLGGALFIFSVYPNALNKIGQIFGVARGADVLVYISIIFLVYFALLLFKKIVENEDQMTELVREIAINNSEEKLIKGREVFVIPVYNEEKVVLETINKIIGAGYKNILVINDGSKDGSLKVLKGLGDKIVLLNHLKNRGQGAALETGFEYLRRFGDFEYLITFDADGQHNIDDLKTFEKYIDLNKEAEVFLGTRFSSKDDNVPFTRKILLKAGIIFTWLVSGIRLSDTHNGYRVIKSKVLPKICLTHDGMSHASEIIDIISREKIKYKEVPVKIEYTEYSMQKGQKSTNAITIVLKTIWGKFFR